eukprot:Clim_evm81s207 gene=Clim_evmTU81s207
MSTTAKLVLHLDVNKTIVMSDPAGGKTVETVCQELLAETCWGMVVSNGNAVQKWEAVSSFPNQKPTGASEYADPIKIGSICTYKMWIDSQYPYPKYSSTQEKTMLMAGVKDAKQKRTALVTKFTSEGEPGDRYRPYFRRLMDSLTYKDGEEQRNFYVIEPFLHLLRYLDNTGVDYSVVLRTFGEDLPHVIRDLNVFGNGLHGRFKGVSLQKFREIDMVQDVGIFFRDGVDKYGTVLIWGTLERNPDLDDGREFYQSQHGDKTMHDSFSGILKSINKHCDSKFCVGIQDYYDWWSANNEASGAGKLFIIDPSDTGRHHLFLDDNIRPDEPEKSIVDIRHVDGHSIALDNVLNKYAIKIDPYEALVNDNYFIRCVGDCHRAWCDDPTVS